MPNFPLHFKGRRQPASPLKLLNPPPTPSIKHRSFNWRLRWATSYLPPPFTVEIAEASTARYLHLSTGSCPSPGSLLGHSKAPLEARLSCAPSPERSKTPNRSLNLPQRRDSLKRELFHSGLSWLRGKEKKKRKKLQNKTKTRQKKKKKPNHYTRNLKQLK